MKKLGILILAAGLYAGSATAYPDIPSSAINDIQGLQGIHRHDMQLMQQQIFRKQEMDETKDIQEQKEKKKRELENADIRSDDPAIKKMLDKHNKTKDVNFVEQDGQIKIENSPSEPVETEAEP